MKTAARTAVPLLLAAAALGPSPVHAAGPPPAIVVTLLGTGNPRPSPDRFGPSTLVEAGGKRILVDAGRGATIRLLQLGGPKALPSLDLVLLTHLHSDHVVGLPDLWLTPWIFGRSRALPVRGPSGTAAMADGLRKAFAFDVETRRDVDERFPADGVVLDARDVDPGVVWEEAGLKVTAFLVDHGPVKPSFGYRIDYRGRSVVLSGDTRPVESLVEASRGTDVLIHEVISPNVEARRTGVADPEKVKRILERHTTPEEAGKVFARVTPRLAVYSHVVPSPAKPAELIAPTRRTYGGPLAVGYDLMSIEIGERVRVVKRKAIGD